MRTFEIVWDMPSWAGDIFVEIITPFKGKIVSDYVGWGNYYANFVWLYCIKNDISKLTGFEPSEQWDYICKFLGVDYEKSSIDNFTVVFETINKITTTIYQFAFYCMDTTTNKTKKFKHIYDKILEYNEIVGETSMHDEKDMFCIKYLQDGMRCITDLLDMILNGVPANHIIAKICKAINSFIDNNKNERNGLLHSYAKFDKDDRCVAAYIFDEPQNKKEGYIAFSGFTDVENSAIKQELKLDEKKYNGRSFFDKIIEIADNLNYILIITNEEVSIYGVPYNVYNGKIKVDSTLAREINLGLKDIGKIKKLYSCCERKIFTAFYKENKNKCLPEINQNKHFVGYYIGKLYIKKPPCFKCSLGIKYEWEKGHTFMVIPQITTSVSVCGKNN